MAKRLAFFLSFLIATTAAQSQPLDQRIEELTVAVEPRVLEWRRDIHQNPELSNREFRTAAKVADHLKSLGLEVTTEVAHTGVVGILRGGKPGPMIALRADMDGLPVTERTDVPFASRARDVYNGEEVGVMHACGHDTHVAILMGVAEILSAVRNEIPGSIKFIFQPAEEGPPEGEKGGAPMMLEEGVLRGVEAIFALHIDAQREVGGIYYRSGGIMASVDDFRITLTGRQTHGAAPWQGVDPIVTAAQIINSLQTIVSRNVDVTQSAAVVTVGSIHGGVRSNIIPEEVVMVGTIRALEPAVREAIHERVREIVSNTGESMGVEAKVEIPMTFGLPVTYNDPDLTSRMLPTLEKVAGAHRVHVVAAETGAEDFSVFAEKVPGFYFFLGGRPANISEEESASHHTPDFFVDESGLGLGVRAMTGLALDYLNQAEAR